MRGGGQIQIGRTIAEKRERVETASERLEARKRSKQQKAWRVFLVTGLFMAMAVAFISLVMTVLSGSKEELVEVVEVPYKPTIEVIDECEICFAKDVFFTDEEKDILREKVEVLYK